MISSTTNNLNGRIVVIAGGTRGIGFEIAKALHNIGARVIILGHSIAEDERLGGTIYSAAESLNQSDHTQRANAVFVDYAKPDTILSAVEQVKHMYGVIDILVNCTSAINLMPFDKLPAKKLELMHNLNDLGVERMLKASYPLLKASTYGAQVITMSPPIFDPSLPYGSTPYARTKRNMSQITQDLGAVEPSITTYCLWPASTIWTKAVENELKGIVEQNQCRKPEIVGRAALYLVTSDFKNGCYTDAQVLQQSGEDDLSGYQYETDASLMPDLFLTPSQANLVKAEA